MKSLKIKGEIFMKYPELILAQMEIGPLNNFIYFLGDAKTKEIAIVDPGVMRI
jgi:hypothetical protein